MRENSDRRTAPRANCMINLSIGRVRAERIFPHANVKPATLACQRGTSRHDDRQIEQAAERPAADAHRLVGGDRKIFESRKHGRQRLLNGRLVSF